MKIFKLIIIYFIALIISLAFIYGCYYVGKYVSYSLFYKDMVIETIKEVVKPEYLR